MIMEITKKTTEYIILGFVFLLGLSELISDGEISKLSFFIIWLPLLIILIANTD